MVTWHVGSYPVSLIDILSFQIYSSNVSSTVWGQPELRLPPTYAAFVNGVAVRRFPWFFYCSTIRIISEPEYISEISQVLYPTDEFTEVQIGEVSCPLAYVVISVSCFYSELMFFEIVKERK